MTKKEIMEICSEEAASYSIVSASIHGSRLREEDSGDKDRRLNVLLVVDSPKLTLQYKAVPFKNGTLSILIVDRKTFEKDVANDWLGGLLVENMLIPYEPLVNKGFLWQQEVKAKKRLVTEMVDNLVLEYPEMSHELLIKPEYFMFEAMARKASLYPPITYRFMKILEGPRKEENQKTMMKGFETALRSACEDGIVAPFDGYFKITQKRIAAVKRRKLRVLNLLKAVRTSMLRHTVEVFPKMMRSMIEDYMLYIGNFVDPQSFTEIHLFELEDTKKHIFIPTALGLVSLSEKVTIEDFVKTALPGSRGFTASMKRLGGVLNAVYALQLRNGGEQKIIVKAFKNWYGWKWFPLALWAVGTRGFAVLGKSRLEREYAINRLLSTKGFNVPKIIHVSAKEGLIFQEYVEGETLSNTIRRMCSSEEDRINLTATIRRVGKEIAKVHALDVSLGDCKPENIIVTSDGRIFFVDLEQAERGGDKVWDLAELFYYSGHYVPLSSVEMAQTVTKAYIEGYLKGGGKPENVEKTRSPRYIKVFSFFTPPHILYAISITCGETLKGIKQRIG